MSNLTYENVLDQALALSPEDRERLINQLTAHYVELKVNRKAAPLLSYEFIAFGSIPICRHEKAAVCGCGPSVYSPAAALRSPSGVALSSEQARAILSNDELACVI
jgi:hypothetical protein